MATPNCDAQLMYSFTLIASRLHITWCHLIRDMCSYLCWIHIWPWLMCQEVMLNLITIWMDFDDYAHMQSCIVWISRGLTWSDSICATPWLLDQQTQSDCAIWYMPQFCKCSTTPFYCHDFNDTHIHLLCKSDLQTQSKNTFICMSINKTLLPLNCIFAEITPEGWSQSWVWIGPDDSHQCYGWVMMQRGYDLGDI